MKRLKESLLARLSDVKVNLDCQLRQMVKIFPTYSTGNQYFTPTFISQGLSSAFMLTCLGITVFWLMQILQIPQPEKSLTKQAKGEMLYSNLDSSAGYQLFGSKPLAAANITLRGVVLTDQSKDKDPQGFALFDIEGKPTGPIAIGETMGKGLSLKSITADSATLLYQGNVMHFSLQNSKKAIKAKSN